MSETHIDRTPVPNREEEPDMPQEGPNKSEDIQESDVGGPQVQIVVVSIEQHLCGIKILAVREIVKVPKITWVPWTPEYVIGVINIRGDLHSVVDLKQFFQLGTSQVSKQSRIIIAESDDLVAGFLVDDMLDIIDVPVASFLPMTELQNSGIRGYVEGTFPWNETEVFLLNIDMLLQGVVVNQG
jgi:purine-binding chemotaxis protein CheW